MVVLASLCVVSGAEAQSFKSFRDKIFGKPVEDGRSSQAVPKVAHFVSEDGESFVFDSSRSVPLLRFDGDDEVFALTATPGTRGDIIYKNDMGQPVLKATRWGGMVLFSDGRPMGDPVAVKGKADTFQPVRMSPEQLLLHLAKSSYRASRAIEHKVFFNADADTPGDSTIALFADAATVTADALIQAGEQGDTRRALDGLHEVHFVEGRPPSARFENGVLIMKLDPSRGTWGGHVSSKRIVKVLSASFSLAVGH